MLAFISLLHMQEKLDRPATYGNYILACELLLPTCYISILTENHLFNMRDN